ncbi:MAG: 1-acyl-sn-glycerol-3-phosphate acyltransferase [Shewanella psychromarinicola]|uniref:1-acyl-sn-glycerol-3-phosphate acyltransferase n=1 Tax=Shewanella psychromarinicola TaxID=2487742 RepID=UPI0030036349
MFSSLCSGLLKILGWKLDGQLDKTKPCVIIVGPHTSNWDFIIGIIARSALGTKIHFLGKHQLFIPPWGWLFRAMGGSPVVRRKYNSLVDGVVLLFQQDPLYKLALAPEGTRSPVTRWKSGFYHIAAKADVDIVPIGLDFGRKAIVIAKPLRPTGDIEREINQLMDFYRSIKGCHPKKIPNYQQSSDVKK